MSFCERTERAALGGQPAVPARCSRHGRCFARASVEGRAAPRGHAADDELVAVQTGDEVLRPHQPAQPRCDGMQNVVARVEGRMRR